MTYSFTLFHMNLCRLFIRGLCCPVTSKVLSGSDTQVSSYHGDFNKQLATDGFRLVFFIFRAQIFILHFRKEIWWMLEDFFNNLRGLLFFLLQVVNGWFSFRGHIQVVFVTWWLCLQTLWGVIRGQSDVIQWIVNEASEVPSLSSREQIPGKTEALIPASLQWAPPAAQTPADM